MMEKINHVMKQIPLSLLLVLTIAFCISCSGNFINNVGMPLDDVVEIAGGSAEGYPDSGEVQKLINTEEEFIKEWEKIHTEYLEHGWGVPDLPQVDFAERDIILVMLETRSHGGIYIKDLQVLLEKERINIKYLETASGCTVPTIISKDFKMYSIPSIEIAFPKIDKVNFQKKEFFPPC